MSDTTVPATTETTPAPVATTPPATLDAPADETKFSAEYVKQLRSEAASYREKLRLAEAAEAKRKEADDAKAQAELSELDRLKAQLADATAKARTLEVQAIRTKAALAHKLQDDLHEFVTAEDEAGAMAQAEKLAARITKPGTGAALPPGGGRAPAHDDKPKGFTDEQRAANAKRYANAF